MFKRMSSTTRGAIIVPILFVGFAVVFASERGWQHAVGIGVAGLVTVAAFAAIVHFANRTPKGRTRT